MENKEIKIGQKYGEWTIIDTTLIKKGINNKLFYITCKCSCGNISEVIKSRLIKGITKGCKKCSSARNKQALGKIKHRGIGEISSSMFTKIKRHSKDRRRKEVCLMPFTITIEYLWELFLKQNRKCAISGLPLTMFISNKKITDKDYHSYITASLDRIDSNKGYVEGNVQWVHKWVNIMKNSMKDEELLYLCQLIYLNNKDNFEPSLVNVDFLKKVSRKVQRLTNDSSTLNNFDTRIRHPQSEGDDIV
jgi:hypothetical protein